MTPEPSCCSWAHLLPLGLLCLLLGAQHTPEIFLLYLRQLLPLGLLPGHLQEERQKKTL